MIIFRYLAREVLVSMIAVSGVLLLIIMSGRFVRYLSEAAAGKLSPEVLFAIMGYRLPGFLELILPLGLFIAFLLAYGRLYMESEMVVLSACGMSQQRLVAYSLFPAGLVALVVALLSMFISPLGIEKTDDIFAAQKKRSEFDHMSPARFQLSSAGGGVTYAETLSDDRKLMKQVFIAEMGDSSDSDAASKLAVVVAATGEQVIDPDNGERYLKLSRGYRYSGNPGEADYRIVEFATYWQHLPRKDQGLRTVEADSMPTLELFGSPDRDHIAALHWRLSLPVLVLIVTLLAVPLSKTNPRQGRYVQMIPAILLYIIYLVSLNAARGAVEDGASPWLTIWAVHGGVLTIAMILLFWPHWRLQWKARRDSRGSAHA